MKRLFLVFLFIFTLLAEKKIIISHTDSDFKKGVIKKLQDKYEDYTIKTIPLSDLEDVKYDDHDVIVIMDDFWAWGAFNSKVKSFIDDLKDKEKIVLVMTAGDPEAEWSYEGIDAVTSASEKIKINEIAIDVSKKIDKIIKNQKNR